MKHSNYAHTHCMLQGVEVTLPTTVHHQNSAALRDVIGYVLVLLLNATLQAGLEV